ncbi:hypothetical protein H4CHR_01275 [Variovorax sp. PBS-H4]|nr:hypothetical protein H4CHR_01275 [Variovorax sp. PBS-H4]
MISANLRLSRSLCAFRSGARRTVQRSMRLRYRDCGQARPGASGTRYRPTVPSKAGEAVIPEVLTRIQALSGGSVGTASRLS